MVSSLLVAKLLSDFDLTYLSVAPERYSN